MVRRSQKKRSVDKKHRILTLHIAISILIGAIVIIASVYASLIKTRPFENAAVSCNDNQCQNVLWTSGKYQFWSITNCGVSCDPNGDQQLCNQVGRVGECRGKSYCCPAKGAKWTTNMAKCQGNTYVNPCGGSTPTKTPTVTRTPTQTQTQIPPTQTPYPTYTPYPSNTRYPTATPTRRPTSSPRPTSTVRPTVTPTPTPVPLLSDVCGKSCVTDTDCQLGLTCATVFATIRACRNRLCPDKLGCLCDDSGGSFFYATPTPGPGSVALRSLPLTIGSFADRKGQTNLTPTISGISEPDAKITITVYPDGVGGEVYADKNGKWSYKFIKKLSPGAKSMLIVATKPDGQAQATKTFTAVGGSGGNIFGTLLLIMVLAAVGFGVYVYVKSNQ